MAGLRQDAALMDGSLSDQNSLDTQPSTHAVARVTIRVHSLRHFWAVCQAVSHVNFYLVDVWL
jgi:hypothetical protein